MPLVVNSNARIMCTHGGQVQLIPKQTTVLAEGAPVMRETDLIGAPILGCTVVPSAGSKPCLTVISTLPGGSNPQVTAVGLPVHIQTLSGITDGVPPGTISVVYPGQSTVNA